MAYSDIVPFLYHLSFEITVKENNNFFLYMKKKTEA